VRFLSDLRGRQSFKNHPTRPISELGLGFQYKFNIFFSQNIIMKVVDTANAIFI